MSNLDHARLGDLLNRTYELEGLLLLALSRQGEVKQIESLITSKIFNLADIAAGYTADGAAACGETPAEEPDDSYALEEEDPDLEVRLVAADDPEAPMMEAPVAEEEETEEAEPEPEIDPIAEEAASKGLLAETIAPEAAETGAESTAGESTPVELEVPAPAMAEVSLHSGISENHSIPGPIAEPIAHATPAAPAQHRAEGPLPRPVFSLNDRYMFTRTLFHNSKKEFDDAVRYIAGLESFDEAEDYLINELEWNPEDQDAKQFIEVIHRYFNAL